MECIFNILNSLDRLEWSNHLNLKDTIMHFHRLHFTVSIFSIFGRQSENIHYCTKKNILVIIFRSTINILCVIKQIHLILRDCAYKIVLILVLMPQFVPSLITYKEIQTCWKFLNFYTDWIGLYCWFSLQFWRLLVKNIYFAIKNHVLFNGKSN